MNRKNLILVVGLALLLALLAGTATTSLAAPPADKPDAAPRLSAPSLPADGPFSATAPSGKHDPAKGEAINKADLAALEKQIANSPIKPEAPDSKNLPEAVRAAVALHDSLTADQRSQMNALQKKYSPEVKALTDAGLAAGKPNAPTKGKAPENVRAQAAKMAAIAAKMDRDLAKILSGEQYANHVAATRPTFAVSLGPVAPQAGQTESANAPDQNSYCYYGAYYELLAKWYKYYGYYWAYYNYVTYGDTYAYYGYLYGYYAYYYYAVYSGPWLAAAYFEYLTIGYDWQGDGSKGRSYAYYDYYYAYYSYYNSYYSYYYYGHSYAYNAQYYEYYAQYYGYYGYYYGYYCT